MAANNQSTTTEYLPGGLFTIKDSNPGGHTAAAAVKAGVETPGAAYVAAAALAPLIIGPVVGAVAAGFAGLVGKMGSVAGSAGGGSSSGGPTSAGGTPGAAVAGGASTSGMPNASPQTTATKVSADNATFGTIVQSINITNSLIARMSTIMQKQLDQQRWAYTQQARADKEKDLESNTPAAMRADDMRRLQGANESSGGGSGWGALITAAAAITALVALLKPTKADAATKDTSPEVKPAPGSPSARVTPATPSTPLKSGNGLTKTAAAQHAMQYFMSKHNMSREDAAAAVGNLMQESGDFSAGTINNSAAKDSAGNYLHRGDQTKVRGGSQYIAQWNKDRLNGPNGIKTMYGEHPTLDQQLAFISYELAHEKKDVINRMRSKKTLEEKTDVWRRYYEGGKALFDPQRHQKARQALALPLPTPPTIAPRAAARTPNKPADPTGWMDRAWNAIIPSAQAAEMPAAAMTQAAYHPTAPSSFIQRQATRQSATPNIPVFHPPIDSAMRMTGRFGTWRPGKPGHTHQGVDIGTPVGTLVHAIAAGRVTIASWVKGYGNVVYVNHGSDWQTRYAHLSKISVHVGMDVHAGTLLGLSGNTGHSTGPHLHMEVRYKKVARSDVWDYVNGTKKIPTDAHATPNNPTDAPTGDKERIEMGAPASPSERAIPQAFHQNASSTAKPPATLSYVAGSHGTSNGLVFRPDSTRATGIQPMLAVRAQQMINVARGVQTVERIVEQVASTGRRNPSRQGMSRNGRSAPVSAVPNPSAQGAIREYQLYFLPHSAVENTY